jgi:hypothetical protein
MTGTLSASQPVEVIAHFDLEGRITPLRLTWRDVEYPLSAGRHWEGESGQHFMVMAPGEQVLELLFVPGERRWYLRSPRRGLA